MSSLMEHAKRECEFMLNGGEMDKMMYNHLIHMVDEFGKEEHSGFSAGYATGCLNKLFRFEPLRPLQGTDDEWEDVSENKKGQLFQNNRCGRVFKDGEDNAWDIDGKVFVESNGLAFTNSDSKVRVTFPYAPKTKYVYVRWRYWLWIRWVLSRMGGRANKTRATIRF